MAEQKVCFLQLCPLSNNVSRLSTTTCSRIVREFLCFSLLEIKSMSGLLADCCNLRPTSFYHFILVIGACFPSKVSWAIEPKVSERKRLCAQMLTNETIDKNIALKMY